MRQAREKRTALGTNLDAPSIPRRSFLAIAVLSLVGCTVESQAQIATPSVTAGAAGAVAPTDSTHEVHKSMADLGFELAKKAARVEFTLQTTDGSAVTLEHFAGDYILLNFWATWCAPCRIEMPSMERLHQSLHKEGLRLVAVNLGEEAEQVERFVREHELTFEILMDPDLAAGRTYAARSLPMTYVIDPVGQIVARIIGAREWDSPRMAEMFAALVAEDPS